MGKETKNELQEKLLQEAQTLFGEARQRAKITHESIVTQQRIELAQALTELTLDIRTHNENRIREIEIQKINQIKEYIDSDSFDFVRLDDAALLYNLAIWYGLLYESIASIPNVNTKEESRRYLTYSLALSDNLRDSIELDKNFEFLVKEGDLGIIKEELAMRLNLTDKAERAKMGREAFKAEINRILERVDARIGRSGR